MSSHAVVTDTVTRALRFHPTTGIIPSELPRRVAWQQTLVRLADALIGDLDRAVAALIRQPAAAPSILARIGVVAADRAHAELCGAPGPPVACQRDIELAWVLTAIAGHRLAGMEPDRPWDRALILTLIDPTLPSHARVGALTNFFDTALRPAAPRQPMPVRHDSPIVEIDAPISAIDDLAWRRSRRAAHALASVIRQRGARPDITSDHISPVEYRAEDEWTTRTCALRASAVIILASGGAIGTGRTLETCFNSNIPTLVLVRADEAGRGDGPVLGARYDGTQTGQRPIEVRSLAEAAARTHEFLKTKDLAIHRRTRRLAVWDHAGDPPERAHALALSAADLDAIDLSATAVEFWTRPVVWQQTAESIRTDIRDAIAARTRHRSRHTSNGGKSRRTLRGYVRVEGLPRERELQLWAAYQTELASAPASARIETTAYEFDDWAALDRRLPG